MVGLGRLIAALFILVPLAGACSPSASPPSAPKSADAKPATKAEPKTAPTFLGTVRVSSVGVPVTPSYNVAEFARVSGIFRDNGLEVEIQNNLSATQSVPPVVTGQADVVFTGADNVLGAMAQGQPLKLYMFPANNLRFVLAARKEIRDWADLRGKTVAATSIGNTGAYTLAAETLKAHGIGEKDVQWVATSQRMAALATNRAQATVTTPEDYLSANDPDTYIMERRPGLNVPFHPGSSIGAKAEWVEKNPQIMRAFIKSMVQAGRKMNSDKAEFIRVGRELREELSAEVLGLIWDLVNGMNYWAVNGGIDEEKFERFLAYFYQVLHPELAEQSKIKSVKDAVDQGPLKNVLDEIGVVQGYDQPVWYKR